MMAQRMAIVQLGKGTIGAALIDQIAARRSALRELLGIDLTYVGIAGRSRAAFRAGGIDLSMWRRAVSEGVAVDGRGLLQELRGLADPKVLIDATAEDGMPSLYREATEAGFHIVSCNKKPLSGSLADYRGVKAACRAAGRSWLYEVTVGAGLPTISSLRDLVESGDRIRSIEGCFSGTLNELCSGLDRGEPFSTVLKRAKEMGFTEPDPREDLSGADVARKALILAREAGLAVEPDGVSLEPFLPVDPAGDTSSFLASIAALDERMAQKWREAAGRGMRWRYVATVDDGCGAALKEVPADSPLGRLAGPENVFAFRTERYADHPLMIAGPGAGPAVTAAGAFGDILKLARGLAGRGGIE
jgi:aspartokinase/homoserine dehydrogenase 1